MIECMLDPNIKLRLDYEGVLNYFSNLSTHIYT